MLSDKDYLDKIGFLHYSKYILNLTWDKVKYEKGVCYLKNAYFYGPVLDDLEQMYPNDFIILDFYKQYYMYSATAYLVRLDWGALEFDTINKRIKLKNVKLTHATEMNNVPKIRNKDFIRINTKGHDIETHANFPTYEATVLNEIGEAYNFWRTDGRFRKV